MGLETPGVVIALPIYGGMVCAEFMDSLSRLTSSLDGKIPYRILTQYDSLVTRSRNCLVARFMTDPELSGYRSLLFLDADIVFEPEDVAKLWNLDVPVAVGCYPTKRDDCVTTAWKDGRLVELEKLDGPTSIDYAGTGFMLIHRDVFSRMQEAFPETRHREGRDLDVHALFDCEVTQGERWQDRWYVSEDYLFCKRWRDLGGEIILDPSIRLGHVGRKVYWSGGSAPATV